MLDKLEKLEEKVNKLLERVFNSLCLFFKKLIFKIIPKSFFSWIEDKKLKQKAYIEKSAKIQKERAQLALSEFGKRKDQLFDTLSAVQKYPIKEKIIIWKSQVIEFIFQTHPKVHWFTFKEFAKKHGSSFRAKLAERNNIYTKVYIGSFIMLVISGSIIYISGLRIYENEFPYRAPANVQEYDYRPEYRLYEKKSLKVQNLKVPVWATGVEKIDTITIDISIRTSTRFASFYLGEYEYKLRDYFFTAMQPVVSEFPIESEGKEIIKEKIQEELNYFLQTNNVEGEVEEVHILYIVGS